MSIRRADPGSAGEVRVTAPRRPRQATDAALDPDSAGEGRLAAVPAPTRGGEDARRRGWFWHWNALVTQYAPLIGLKGVGLLNSYTVWTDRREESPHRGYAFPSQQSEADFYGEDRAELITINKILVALDLIEIRKEMVLRADPQGRRWKVPHNFYRVKDHGDDFTLSTPDVLRVAELAARDRAVYRYVRRVFSARFSPIDSDNVWSRILPEVQRTPVWQELAAKAAAEDDRASARTRAGHAARGSASRKTPAPPDSRTGTPFFTPSSHDAAATATDDSDSSGVDNDRGEETSVAAINTGSAVDVAPANRGSGRGRQTAVAPGNDDPATAVAPANTTYNQSQTTTRKRIEQDGEIPDGGIRGGQADTRSEARQWETTGGPADRPPMDAAAEAAALRAFESANDRAATPAERKLLRDLAARLDAVAEATRVERPGEEIPSSGWGWIEAAVWEAVEAGSAYVAPRRVREIALRWEREGYPVAPDLLPPEPPRGAPPRRTGRAATPEMPRPLPPTFVIEEVGLSNRQVWAAALAELARSGEMSQAELETWLRPAGIIGRAGETLIIGAPNAVARDRIASRLLPALSAALAVTVGEPLAVAVEIEGETGSGPEGARAS
jgi:hypothetical protein